MVTTSKNPSKTTPKRASSVVTLSDDAAFEPHFNVDVEANFVDSVLTSHLSKLHAEALVFKRERARSKLNLILFYSADPITRVHAIKAGIPAKFVEELVADMHVPKEWLLPTLGISTATFNRKKNKSEPLSKDDSERVMGIARLVGQVQNMVQESGDSTGFNAAQWVAQWLDDPLPALGGMKPKDLMDTAEGQAIVSDLISRAQSGAYA